MTRRGWALLAVVGGFLAAPAVAPAAVTPTTATFAPRSDWGSGFTGTFVLHNGAATPLRSWRLEFDLPAGQRLTSAWGALIARSDQHVVLTPVAYTKTIPAGGSLSIGFQGVESAPFAAPTGCRFNGVPCAGVPVAAPSPASLPARLPKPTGLVLSAVSPTTATLRWTPAAAARGVTSYDVFRGATKVATATGPTATITGLHPRSRYAFTVRAVDAAARVSARSAPVSVRTPLPAPGLDGTLTADVATVEDWGTGYVGSVVIRNRGTTPVTGWQLVLDLPAGTTLDTAWSAALTVNGSRATLAPAFWTRTIAAGGSVYVGFQGTSTGPFPGPVACTVNGAACAGR